MPSREEEITLYAASRDAAELRKIVSALTLPNGAPAFTSEEVEDIVTLQLTGRLQ